MLYGGAVALAGNMTSRKSQRATTSDWMELERQRGISISSTVLQLEHEGNVINLLDTQGHKDISEDTYWVLTAVDAAVMVSDAGRGIEMKVGWRSPGPRGWFATRVRFNFICGFTTLEDFLLTEGNLVAK